MSDLPQGPDWWRASDGLYYPPEAHPDHTAQPAAEGQDSGTSSTPEPHSAPSDAAVEDEPPLFDLESVEPTRTSPTIPTGLVDDDLYDREWPAEEEAEPPRRRLLPVLAIVAVVGLVAGVGIWYLLEGGNEDTTASPTTTTGDPSAPSTSEATTTTAPSDEVSPFALEVSDCFDTLEVEDEEGLRVSMVKLIDCADPHQAEVVSIGNLEGGADAEFPGDAARDTAAEELCTPEVEEFLGGPLAVSDLVLVWLAPTAESWTEDGDREVVCVVAAPDGQFLARSMEGASVQPTDDTDQAGDSDTTDGEATPEG